MSNELELESRPKPAKKTPVEHIPVDSYDSDWLSFWWVVCSVCLLASVVVPTVIGNGPQTTYTWFWSRLMVAEIKLADILWIALPIAVPVLLLVLQRFLYEKLLAATGLIVVVAFFFVLSLTPTVTFSSGKQLFMGTDVKLLFFYFIVGLVLLFSGTHLQKIYENRLYPAIMLIVGGIVVWSSLFFPNPWTTSGGVILALFSKTAWSGSALYYSTILTALSLVCLVAIISFVLNTRTIMSYLLRLFLILVPVLLYLMAMEARQLTVLDNILVTLKPSLFLIGMLILPVTFTATIEYNTLVD